MATIEKEYQPYPDSGSLMASKSKAGPKSPDYYGDLAIRVEDLTAVKMVDGLYCIKLSGWKKVSSSGSTYLSLSVSRYVPEGEKPKAKPDEDVDF